MMSIIQHGFFFFFFFLLLIDSVVYDLSRYDIDALKT